MTIFGQGGARRRLPGYLVLVTSFSQTSLVCPDENLSKRGARNEDDVRKPIFLFSLLKYRPRSLSIADTLFLVINSGPINLFSMFPPGYCHPLLPLSTAFCLYVSKFERTVAAIFQMPPLNTISFRIGFHIITSTLCQLEKNPMFERTVASICQMRPLIQHHITQDFTS